MKKIILFGIISFIIPSVLADYGHMMRYGYGMSSNLAIGLYGFIWFVIATFIFSIIFWSTYKWIIKEAKENKIRRR